jgi:hypothetical protein
MIPEEATWLKPREGWDPKLVWVLRSFLAHQDKWNPDKQHWFEYRSPRFYVVLNEEIVTTATGVSGWQGTIAPMLKQLVGA